MALIRIACPKCNRVLMLIDCGEILPKVTVSGIVNIRCPKCMEWQNVLDQLQPYQSEHPEVEES